MHSLLIYILIGIAYMGLNDWFTQYIEGEDVRFTNKERLLVITLWPVFIIYLIVSKAFKKWQPKWTTCYNTRDRFIPLLKGHSKIVSPRENLAMRMLRSRQGHLNRIRSCHSCPMARADPRCRNLSTAPMTQPAQIIVLAMRLALLGMSTVRLLAKSWKKHLRITKKGRNSTTMWKKRRKLKCARI